MTDSEIGTDLNTPEGIRRQARANVAAYDQVNQAEARARQRVIDELQTGKVPFSDTTERPPQKRTMRNTPPSASARRQ